MSSSKEPSGKKSNKIIKGRAFEDRAGEFYVDQGYDILERNWQASHKEIDLIVRRDKLIVFVEVKASFSGKFGHPAEWVGCRKRRNLSAAAMTYIESHDTDDCDFRFDVITFVNGQLEHYPDAFPSES